MAPRFRGFQSASGPHRSGSCSRLEANKRGDERLGPPFASFTGLRPGSPRPVRGAEHTIPEMGGYAKVARVARVMVQGVAALPGIEIRSRLNAPVVEHVMHADVPDITQHQARGDPAGEIEAGLPPQRK